MTASLGKTLLIANPAAQNGNGAGAARRAEEVLRAELGEASFAMVLTESAGQAVELAARAGNYDTVLALGGDGIVHEVVNGLMSLSEKERLSLGVIPIGSGNDYARTLNMPTSLDAALRVIQENEVRFLDVGKCNHEYFAQTLSFGLDAAIAHDTVQRRKRTGRTGTMLYLESGIDQLLHHLSEFSFTAQLNNRVIEGSAFLFAIQIGCTYGGGFRICPDAQPDDGLFDLCIARPPLSVARATFIFLLAKNGWHTGFSQVENVRTASMRLQFNQTPPAQMDGELVCPADTFDISIVPRALRVYMPVR